MKFRKDVIQNISWMYIYRMVRLPLAFIITAWLARFLGPGKYGAYVYAIAIAELLMLFWSQGLKEVVIQEIRKKASFTFYLTQKEPFYIRVSPVIWLIERSIIKKVKSMSFFYFRPDEF
jgi:hypothetical protein